MAEYWYPSKADALSDVGEFTPGDLVVIGAGVERRNFVVPEKQEELVGMLYPIISGGKFTPSGEWETTIYGSADAISAGDAHIRNIKAGLGLSTSHADALTGATVSRIKAEGAAEERARIRAELQELKPRPRKLTHGDWARSWREEGAAQLWEQIAAAIGGEE
jgi:hypothetical protein